jgi:hypothetical protein
MSRAADAQAPDKFAALTHGSQSWPWPTFIRMVERARFEFIDSTKYPKYVPRDTHVGGPALNSVNESERQTSGMAGRLAMVRTDESCPWPTFTRIGNCADSNSSTR